MTPEQKLIAIQAILEKDVRETKQAYIATATLLGVGFPGEAVGREVYRTVCFSQAANLDAIAAIIKGE